MMQSTSLKAKATELKRDHILEAAIRIFAERGFQRATIHDIAVEAGVADGTIYTAFKNKAALLLAILDAKPGEMPEALPSNSQNDPALIIRHLLAKQWEALTPKKLAMLRVVLSEALVDPEVRTLYMEQVIAPVVNHPRGPFANLPPSAGLSITNLPMTMRLLTGAFFGLVMLRLLGDETLEREAEQIPEYLSKLVLEGLLPRSDAQS